MEKLVLEIRIIDSNSQYYGVKIGVSLLKKNSVI